MRPSRSSSTCDALAWDWAARRDWPLGAATGRPTATSNARATGCEGIRTANRIEARGDLVGYAIAALEDER
jgi:hypothetical protein